MYPYDSVGDLTLNETDSIETDLTDRSFFSPKVRKENTPPPNPAAPIPVPVLQSEPLRTRENFIEPPKLPIAVRRSRRLSIRNERKQAQEEEERARKEIAASFVFRDVTMILANAANREEPKNSSNEKTNRGSVAIGKPLLPFNPFSIM